MEFLFQPRECSKFDHSPMLTSHIWIILKNRFEKQNVNVCVSWFLKLLLPRFVRCPTTLQSLLGHLRVRLKQLVSDLNFNKFIFSFNINSRTYKEFALQSLCQSEQNFGRESLSICRLLLSTFLLLQVFNACFLKLYFLRQWIRTFIYYIYY